MAQERVRKKKRKPETDKKKEGVAEARERVKIIAIKIRGSPHAKEKERRTRGDRHTNDDERRLLFHVDESRGQVRERERGRRGLSPLQLRLSSREEETGAAPFAPRGRPPEDKGPRGVVLSIDLYDKAESRCIKGVLCDESQGFAPASVHLGRYASRTRTSADSNQPQDAERWRKTSAGGLKTRRS